MVRPKIPSSIANNDYSELEELDPFSIEGRRDKARKRRAWFSIIALWGSMLVLGIWMVTGVTEDYGTAGSKLENQARVYTKMIASHDRFDIAMADQIIKSLMMHLSDDDYNGKIDSKERNRIERILLEHRKRLPGIASFTIVGANGQRQFGVAGKNFTDLSERGYYKILKSSNLDLYVSPAEDGWASGKDGVHVARAFRREDGSLGGLIVINLAISDIFYPYYASLGLDESAKTQTRSAYKLLLSYPKNEQEPSGSEIKDTISTLIEQGVPSGVVHSTINGEKWVQAFERLPDTMIYAEVSLSEDAAMKAPRSSAIMAFLAFLLAVTAAIAATKAIFKGLKNETYLASAFVSMHNMANHDALTGLPNRNYLADFFTAYCKKMERTNKSVGLIFVDLDHFKAINDTLGHQAGDDLLKKVSKLLLEATAPEGIVCRIGGDEFVVVFPLPETNYQPKIHQICSAILERFKKPFEIEGATVGSGASLGISVFPHDARSWEELSRKADIAMYYSKGHGRGTFQIYDPSFDDARGKDKLEMHSALLSSIALRAFDLDWLPVWDEQHQIVGAEALLRWHHPVTGTIISAQEILPLIESNGLIIPIGEIVFDLACKKAKSLEVRGTPLKLWVNVSAVQINRSDIEKTIHRALSSHHCSPGLIGIEFKETTLLEERAEPKAVLERLRKEGVAIALDDFGTGYSSLSSLRDFPIDIVKLDGTFARSIEGPAGTLANAAIQMAKTLGIQVVAKGIEREGQWMIYKNMGCSLGQGHLWGEPIKFEELLLLIEKLSS